MKKTYTLIIRILSVLFINIFFIILVRNIPASTTSETELLASVISTVLPNGTYMEQVDLAKSISDISSGSTIQQTVKQLGVFTKEITPASRRAAKEALGIEKSSQ